MHSLRAGYLQTQLLLCQDPEILVKTAIIAGWVPYGKAQRAYIKASLRASLVCNKLWEAIENVRII